jgi:hypothetical protein
MASVKPTWGSTGEARSAKNFCMDLQGNVYDGIVRDYERLARKKSLATGNSRSSGRTLIVKEGALMLEKLRPLTA